MTCGERSTTGVRNTTSAGRTVRLHIEHLRSSAKPWAMEMWKANSASHIPTAPTTTARYTRPQHQTEKLQLWLDEKTGARQKGPMKSALAVCGKTALIWNPCSSAYGTICL